MNFKIYIFDFNFLENGVTDVIVVSVGASDGGFITEFIHVS